MLVRTKEMIQTAQDINSLIVEYQTLISNMYSRIGEMPSTCWSGTRANEYIQYVLLDKDNLMAVGDKLKSFTNTIINDANMYANAASKIWKDESNG